MLGSQHGPRHGRPRALGHHGAVRVPWDRVLGQQGQNWGLLPRQISRGSDWPNGSAAAEPLANQILERPVTVQISANQNPKACHSRAVGQSEIREIYYGRGAEQSVPRETCGGRAIGQLDLGVLPWQSCQPISARS